MSLTASFYKYATKGGNKEATTKDMTRWFTDSGVITKNKTCNSNNLDICFHKIKTKGKLNISSDQVDALILEVAKSYMKDNKLDNISEAASEISDRLMGQTPQQNNVTMISATGGVDRMTDHTQYTGAHKSRFDDGGKGKGINGRETIHDNTGYVGAYKGGNTYDKKH